MNVLLSEYSAGFADYSWILCNELVRYVESLTYLTEQNNDYVSSVDQDVKVYQLFRSFKADDGHKRGTVPWYFNRGTTAVMNCIRRNKYIKYNKPDIVLIQATLSVFDCHFLKKLKKYSKVVLIVHDVIVPTDSMSWNRKSLKKTYDIADLLVVHSETNKTQMMEIFGTDTEKIKVIPHGIRSEFNKIDKKVCRQKLGIEESEKVFLFYGSIRESKGLDILLEAMKGIDGTLLIAGAPMYGETFDKYEEIIRKNGLKTIEYIEYTPDSFRDILFQASDFMILPYKEFYSQSGVFMQSIQFHLPIIATDVSSFREFIERYDIGYICRPNDSGDLHRTIVSACKEGKKFSKMMERAVKENYWEVSAKMYYNLLEGLEG